MMKILFEQKFEEAWDRILSKKPFCHTRYADGEICLIQGKEITNGSQATDVDKWSSPNKITKLGKDLEESLKYIGEDYYYGISCDTSNTEHKNFLLSKIKQDKKYITYSNLWINSNYNSFIKNLNLLNNHNMIIVGNKSGENKKYPFSIKGYMSFDNDCVNVWENNHVQIKRSLVESFSDIQGYTIFVSVGPLSEIIIYELWKINNKNQYIDIGSSLDFYIHGKITRPYMVENSFYNKQVCEMEI
jgi:hypothetical protein